MITFKEHIMEMTLRAGSFNSALLEPTLAYVAEHGKLIGHQDQKEIMLAKHNDMLIYGIKNNGQVTSFLACSTATYFGKDYLVSNVIYTAEKYRSQNDAKRIYWFIKSQEKKRIIGFGVQSEAGIKFTDALAKDHRFSTFWLNLDTGEEAAYDSAKEFRSSSDKTSWRIVVEAVKESPFPRLLDTSHPVLQALSAYSIFS
jgi:hypothetical protein